MEFAQNFSNVSPHAEDNSATSQETAFTKDVKNRSVPSLRYVYALGRIEPRFPTLGVEKEFSQAAAREDTTGSTNRETLRIVLSEARNRYLLRQLNWVLTIEGIDTYLLMPRDPIDFDLLLGSLRPVPRTTDFDVVIGIRSPADLSPETANITTLPMVIFDQLYSFDIDSLISVIPPPETISAEEFRPAAEELFTNILRMAGNAGSADEHRALNYLAMRYQAIYERTAKAYAEDSALTGVQMRSSPLSGPRKIVDVIFSYTSRKTGVVDASFVRVDVTEMYPYLVAKLSPYYRTDTIGY